jgi:hypothetical protein
VPVDYNRLLGHSQIYCIFTDTIPGRYLRSRGKHRYKKDTMAQNGVTDYAGRDRIKRI